MLEIGSFEAKNRLSELLTRAEHGERIFILRRGKRIAMLTGFSDDALPKSIEDQDLLEALRLFRSHANTGPESLKSMIEEGRR